MKRKIVCGLFLAASMLGAAAVVSASDEEGVNVTGTYAMEVDAFDSGAYTSSVLVTLDQEIDAVAASDFAVSEAKDELNYETYEMEESTVDRIVSNAYLADENGDPVDGPSQYVCLELKPSSACKGIFGSYGDYGLNVWETTYHMNIALADDVALTSGEQAVSSITIDSQFTDIAVSDSVKKFDTTQSYTTESGITYNYASYTPEEESGTLFVWLHGLGEGGTEMTDPRIILLAAESTVLAGDEFQEKIGGANILAPQCPTWWMDPDGKGEVLDGSTINSYYAESLDEMIDNYASEIGAEKIVIAGCSNGGYMTMVLALQNPDKYDAIIPVCEALEYSESLNENLDAIKDLPMYFVYSKDDPLVVPETYEIPTLEYLTGIGASDLHTSTTDNVFVTYEGEEPAMQFGHASWIYFFNDETADEDGVSAWDWLAGVLQGE